MVVEHGVPILTGPRTLRLSLFLLTIAAGITCACREKFESYYPSAAAAVKAGEFDRGWLPDVLKPDVTNIREWHDIASNEVRGKFALNERIVKSLQTTCKPGSDVPRKTWSMPAWFPASISSGKAAEHGMQIFRCDDFFVAVDTTAAARYFWAEYP
jgi:hypothetical protein